MNLPHTLVLDTAHASFRPREWTLDNRQAFQAEMRRQSDFCESLPAYYDLGPTKLEEYHSFRRACAFIALAVLTLTACLVLAKLFTPGA
jgi:hypothetical protein